MMGFYDDICELSTPVLAGLAFLFSVGFLLQILIFRPLKDDISSVWGRSSSATGALMVLTLRPLGCALYNNWWPMLTGLMYIMLPMPCLFFGGGSSDFITSGEGGDWADAAKFLTGFSSVGSIAIPAILRHANLITAGAMWIEFTAFFILLSTVMIFQKVSQEDDYY